VAVINEALARRHFPGEDPIGKAIRIHHSVRTIVGLVGDLPTFGLDRETQPAMYLPFLQDQSQPDRMAVRTALSPHELAATVRGAIRQMEPNSPIMAMATVEDDLLRIVASPRFYMLLLGLFAGMALALAVLGVYGVVSFAVTLRTHEIGVRMALGANGGNVLHAVMRQGAMLAAVGAAIGCAAALPATRLLASTSLLFRVKPADPLTFLVVPAVLLVSAAAACWIPARRATKVDPAVALRYE
jgi:predicted lysophospholipase L1 biosynthesis ABC-type transport system permease subunit